MLDSAGSKFVVAVANFCHPQEFDEFLVDVSFPPFLLFSSLEQYLSCIANVQQEHRTKKQGKIVAISLNGKVLVNRGQLYLNKCG